MRESWFHAISQYNADDPAKLAREVWEVGDIYVGMRSRREFEVAKDLADLVIWVDASARHPHESPLSMELNMSDADVVLFNDGTRGDLRRRVQRLLGAL